MTKYNNLLCRFDQDGGLKTAAKLETVLVEAAQDNILLESLEELTDKYPELSYAELKRELPMLPSILKQQTEVKEFISFHLILEGVKCVPATSLNLIPNTVVLIKLVMVLPSTAASSERSFSALRRLKTYLRSTMSQKRLSHVGVCHVQNEYCKAVCIKDVVNSFILNSNSQERKFVFGNLC